MNKKIYKYITSSLVGISLVGTVLPSVSSGIVYADSNLKISNNLTENEKQIADELEFLFSKASKVIDGKVIVDENLLIEKYGKEQAKYIAEGIRILSDKESVKQWDIHYNNTKYNRDWLGCMTNSLVDFLGVNVLTDAFGGGLAGLQGYLAKKAFGEIAKLIAKSAIKTSVPVLLATIVWFSGRCLF